ncbi:MAG TPA: aspartate/glutamate racemase family protein [Burkholderiales bacterium]|nr:aspartate/glutamate racemase family protein [Burkholderiales bacterium]
MRIWYQSLFEDGRLPTYFEGLRERGKALARPGVEVEFHGVPAKAYGGRTPADVVVYPYLASLHAQFILDNALRAQAEGYDAFAVGSVQDPALEEARSLVDIPVVGYGESAMHFACLLGSRFAIMVFGERFVEMMDLRVRRLGLERRALPTALLDASFGDVGQALADPKPLLERFTAKARQLIAQGAQALIPGQLYLSEAIARAGLSRIDEVPIVDGLAATVKMAEVMADLKRFGISVARRGYLHARPPDDMVAQARALHRRQKKD